MTIKKSICLTAALTLLCLDTSPFASAGAAQTAAGSQRFSVDMPIRDLLDHPAASSVLKRYIPSYANDPGFGRNGMFTLRAFQTLRGAAGDDPKGAFGLSELEQIDIELGQIPPIRKSATLTGEDPSFVPQVLVLEDLPNGIGTPKVLFNGKDLEDWDTWLGPPNFVADRLGVDSQQVQPLGLNKDPLEVLGVVAVDGAPAIVISGRALGALIHKGDFGNYRLRLEYKWGDRWYPQKGNPMPRNSGVLYHAYGPYGHFGNWMDSVELEMIPGLTGGAFPVSDTGRLKTSIGHDTQMGPAKHPLVGLLTGTQRRFMVGGRQIVDGQYGFEFIAPATDAEHPIGQWNTIDIYTFRDQTIHVVNGVPVFAATELTYETEAGKHSAPLTHGRIQLESEGAEIFFRNITLQQIEHLPRIVVHPGESNQPNSH